MSRELLSIVGEIFYTLHVWQVTAYVCNNQNDFSYLLFRVCSLKFSHRIVYRHKLKEKAPRSRAATSDILIALELHFKANITSHNVFNKSLRAFNIDGCQVNFNQNRFFKVLSFVTSIISIMTTILKQ